MVPRERGSIAGVTLRNSEISYKATPDVFEAAGHSIIDRTIDGACDVFEKADITDLYTA